MAVQPLLLIGGRMHGGLSHNMRLIVQSIKHRSQEEVLLTVMLQPEKKNKKKNQLDNDLI